MNPTKKYRRLNYIDIEKIANNKRHRFHNSKGQFFGLRNQKQAVIITDKETAFLIGRRLEKRNAKIEYQYSKNNKVYMLIDCGNVASIRALCRRKEIKAPRKIKKLLGLNDILLKNQERTPRNVI